MENLQHNKPKHFVLIHGSSHGAWCWYKLKPMLEKCGFKVTALDMAASGINMKSIQELDTIRQYTEPLLEFLASLPPDEKVILVGHSAGGLNLSVAMETFPQKIAVAVFLSAFMLDTSNQPSYVLEQFQAKGGPKAGWLDTQFTPTGDPKETLTIMLFGPLFMAALYDLSPAEDLELALLLKRPASLFIHDLRRINKLTDEAYGSVKKVFVICKKDLGIPEEFQRWMIENAGVHMVKELVEADHMAMLSVPHELHDCLFEIAKEYVLN